MRNLQKALLALLFLSCHAGHAVMSEERSKCFGMQSIAQEYQGWKADFHRFLSEYNSLSEDLRFRASFSAMNKVVGEIVQLKKMGEVNGHDAVINDAQRLIRDIKNGDITQANAMRVLKTGLKKLEDAMDDIVFRAQKKNDCQLEARADAGTAAPSTK